MNRGVNRRGLHTVFGHYWFDIKDDNCDVADSECICQQFSNSRRACVLLVMEIRDMIGNGRTSSDYHDLLAPV
jgi:hypothetical protein